MEGTLKVTPEELKTQSGTARSCLQILRESLDAINSIMSDMKSYWTGSAAETHINFYYGLVDPIQEMLTGYEGHIKELETMAGVYQEAELKATEQAEVLPQSTL